MPNYRLEDLYWQDFEKLVVAICRQLLGPQVQSFAPGPDGGRDAAFKGTADHYPSAAAPWRGTFVIQAKHTSKADLSCSDSGFYKDRGDCKVRREFKQLKARVAKGNCDCYLLFTNYSGAGKQVEKIEAAIHAETGVANVALISRETLHDTLDEMPDLVRRFRLGKIIKEGHNLPLEGLGDLFVGRDHDLEYLATNLSQQAVALSQTVLGTGGIGKTRLALEFAWRNLDRYRYCFFVNAATAASLNANLADLSDMLNLPKNPQDQDRTIHQVIQQLQTLDGWLMIIDNVDEGEAQDAVNQLLPKLQKYGQVLVTSRRDDWPVSMQTYALGKLSESASIAYLNKHLGLQADNEAQAHAEQLAKELCGLPLALELAVAYIQNRRIDIATYWHEWQNKKAKLLAYHAGKRATYPDSLIIAWQRSLDQVSPAAQSLLRLCAQLAPAPIPRKMFADEAAEKVHELIKAEGESCESLEDALIELADISLIQLNGQAVVLHPLMVDIQRNQTDKSQLQCALGWVDAYAPGHPEDVRTWPIWEPLRPHVASLIERGDHAEILQPTAPLMNNLALLLKTKGQYADAEPLFSRALTLMQNHHGEDAPELATYLSNLATIFYTTNRMLEAESLMRRALAINTATFGKNHPNVAHDLNNLATLLKTTDRLQEAEQLMRRALAIDTAAFGNNHPHVTFDLSQLATLLHATNRLEEAEQLMRRALVIDTATFGEDHPRIALQLNNLATLLQDSNRLREAEPLMRRGLSIEQAAKGEDHPHVAIQLNNLARLLQDTDRLAEALPLLRRALAIFQASYGDDHPDTQLVAKNLASAEAEAASKEP